MNKNLLAFFNGAITVGGICVVFIFSSSAAYAYEVPSAGQLPVPPVLSATGSAQTYDVNTSFSNLISPFENFFNSMRGGSAIPVTLDVGSGNASATITIGIDVQHYIDQYVYQFDAWFYRATGIHIQWLVFMFINIIYWVFGLADSAVRWIVGLFH